MCRNCGLRDMLKLASSSELGSMYAVALETTSDLHGTPADRVPSLTQCIELYG